MWAKHTYHLGGWSGSGTGSRHGWRRRSWNGSGTGSGHGWLRRRLENLAEWVGAVGTTGALLLGFHLLRRDRESNVARPDQISVWRSWQLRPSQDDPGAADVFAQLHIANHSLGLIVLPRVYTWVANDGEAGEEFALKDIPPESVQVIEVPVVDPRVKLCSVLSFKDRRGKTWFKDMHTQKVIHGWKVRRRVLAIRRAKLEWLAQQYRPPAAMLADEAADQAMSW